MSGWHMRVWRRVKVAPGLTINFSKSGPSLSVGPRGSKVTFGRRGVRQTIGLPGTGLYATRQLSSKPIWEHPAEPQPALTAMPPPLPPATEAPAPYEIHYGMPLVAAIVIGIGVAAYGEPATVSVAAAILALITGLLYEALAAHHPLVAKLIAQLVVGIIAVFAVVLGIVLVAAAAGLGASASTRRRS